MSPRGAELLRRAVLFLASMVVVTLVTTGGALTQTQPAMEDADPYIVVLEDGAARPAQVASGIEQRQDVAVDSVYSEVLEGFSATIPEEELAAVRANPSVESVVPDGAVHTVDQRLPWGIDMVGADTSSTLAGNGSGMVLGVKAYVIDTGIYRGPTSPRKKYRDLNVVNHVNFAGGENKDCGEGHGTHVAGVIGAKDNARAVVGVAPGAALTGVKVIGCDGPGLISTVIKGIDWVTADAEQSGRPAIANLSLVAEVASAPAAAALLDDAVRRSVDSGVFYAVAAGNEGKRACDYSPAAAGRTPAPGGGWIYDNGIVTTAAVRDDRDETGWSNYGNCVDLWAPGVDILSTKNRGGLSMMWGTSMAAPHVGGTAALYLSNNPGASPAAVEDALKVDATRVQNEDKRSKDGTRIKVVYAGDY